MNEDGDGDDGNGSENADDVVVDGGDETPEDSIQLHNGCEIITQQQCWHAMLIIIMRVDCDLKVFV